MGKASPLLLLTLFYASSALSTEDAVCREKCEGSLVGHKYEWSGLAETMVAAADAAPPPLTTRASFTLAQGNSCSAIRIDSLHLNFTRVKEVGDWVLWANGELCASPNEPEYSLNVKRAIISLLHTEKTSNNIIMEKDVFGICPTQYSVKQNSGNLFKRKQLDRCSERGQFKMPFPIELESPIEGTMGPIKAEYEAVYKMKDSLVQNADSSETYTISTSDEASIQTRVRSGLILSPASSFTVIAKMNGWQKKSIVYSAETRGYSIGGLDRLLEAASQPGPVGENSADAFSLLSVAIDSSPLDRLNLLVDRTFKNPAKMRVLVSALSGSSSGAAVKMMANLIYQHKLTPTQRYTWLMRLSRTPTPSHVAIGHLIELFEDDLLGEYGYIALGSVTASCLADTDCMSAAPVDYEMLYSAVALGLARPLLKQSQETFFQENLMMASLKGLEALGKLPNTVAEKLVNMALDKKTKTRLRIGAFKAIAADPDKETFRNAASKILQDLSEDTEVRIMAYIVLAASPCNKVKKTIEDVLLREKYNQVISYITSHLDAIMDSKDRHEKCLSSVRRNPQSLKLWDIRKYSKMYKTKWEWSKNISFYSSSNTIFSQNAFLPRQVSLSLRANMYGRRFNIFEVGGRFTNIERILDKQYYFYNDYLFYELADRWRQIVQNPESSLKEEVSNRVNEELGLDLSLKLLGRETLWYKYKGNNDMEEIGNSIAARIGELLGSARQFKEEWRAETRLPYGKVIYGTGIGMGLNLRVESTATARLAVQGEFGERISTTIEPSASLRILTGIFVQGGGAESGIRTVTTIHTSTGGGIAIGHKDGYSFEILLPQQKQIFVAAKTSIELYNAPPFRPITTAKATPIKFDITKVSQDEFSGYWDQLDVPLGLIPIIELALPREEAVSLNPLFGPSKLVIKLDLDAPSYLAFIKKWSLKGREGIGWKIVLDTPESKEDRKIEAELKLGHEPGYFLNASLTTPWSQNGFEAEIVNKEEEKYIYGKIWDGAIGEYGIKVGAKLQTKKGKVSIYKPIFLWQRPVVERKLLGPRTSPTTVTDSMTGSIEIEDIGDKKVVLRFLAVTLTTRGGSHSIDGTMEKGPSWITADLVYNDGDETRISGRLDTITENKNGTRDRHFASWISVCPSALPHLSFNASLSFDTKTATDLNQIDISIILVHGEDLESENERFSFNHFLLINTQAFPPSGVISNTSLTYPAMGIEFKSDLNWKAGDRLTSNTLLIADQLTVDTGMIVAFTSNGTTYDIHFQEKLLQTGIRIAASRRAPSVDTSTYMNFVELYPSKRKYDLNAKAIHKISIDEYHFSVDSELKTPVTPSEVKFTLGLQSKADEGWAVGGTLTSDGVSLCTSQVQFTWGSLSAFISLGKHMEAHGDFTFTDKQVKGLWTFYLPRTRSKLECTVDLEMKNARYIGKLEAKRSKPKGLVETLTINTDTSLGVKRIDTRNHIVFHDDNIHLNFLWDMLEGFTVSSGISGQVQGKSGSLEVFAKYANNCIDLDLAASSPNRRHLALQLQTILLGNSINVTSMGEVMFAGKEKAGNSVKWITSNYISLNLPQVKIMSTVKGEWGREWAELGGEIELGFTSAVLIAQAATSTAPVARRLQVDLASNREGEVTVDIISERERETRDRAVLTASLSLMEPVTTDWHLVAAGSTSSVRIVLHTDALYRFSYQHRQRSGEVESPMVGIKWKITSMEDFLITLNAPQTSLGPGPVQLRLESESGNWTLLCNTEEYDIIFARGTMDTTDNDLIIIYGRGTIHINDIPNPLELGITVGPLDGTVQLVNISLIAGDRYFKLDGSLSETTLYVMSSYCLPDSGMICSISKLAATYTISDSVEDITAEGLIDLTPLGLDYNDMNFLIGYKKEPKSLLHTLSASWDNQSAIAYELNASPDKIGLSIGVGEQTMHMETGYTLGLGLMKGEVQFWPRSGQDQATKLFVEANLDGNDFNCSAYLTGPALSRDLGGKMEMKGTTKGKIEIDVFDSVNDMITAEWAYGGTDDGSDITMAFTKVGSGDVKLYDAKYLVQGNSIQGAYQIGPVKFIETLRVGFLTALYTINTTAGNLFETSLSPRGFYVTSPRGTVASLTTRSKFYVPIYSYYFNTTNFKHVKDAWWKEIVKVGDSEQQQQYKDLIDRLLTDFPPVKLWNYFGDQWNLLKNDIVTVLPSLEEYAGPAEKAVGAISDAVVSAFFWGLGAFKEAAIACWDSALWAWDSIATVVAIILPYWEEFSALPFQAFYAEITDMFAALSDSLIQDIVDMASLTMEQIREHHLFEAVTDYYNELKGSVFGEEVRSDWEEVKAAAEQSATPEMRKLMDTIHHYSEQVRLGHAVDWVAALTQISGEAAATMAPLIRDIMDQVAPSANLEELLQGYTVALPGLGVHKLWELTVGLSQGHVPLPVDLLARCYTFLFIPAYRGTAVLVGGRLVTWDGRWLSLGADGRYVLAKGIGFSLTAVTRRATLHSIHLTTALKDVAYYIDTNKIFVDGKETDWPVMNGITGMIYPLYVTIVSQQVIIICLRTTPVCKVHNTPQLFSATSGLLGKFNHEPYDDFLLPNNTISPSVSELVRSWADDMEIDFSIEPKKIDDRGDTFLHCQGLLTRAPSLQWCSRLVDPAPYRSMCTEGLKPCLAATAYTSHCLAVTKFASLPNLCLKCKAYREETEGNRIDVVLLAEIVDDSPFKEAIHYVTDILRPALNAQGFKSVSIQIIGYKQGWQGIHFSNESSAIDQMSKLCFKRIELRGWKRILRKIEIELGRTERDIVLRNVLSSPMWRPNTVRVVLDAISLKSCAIDTPRTTLHRIIELIIDSKLQRNGISFHTISILPSDYDGNQLQGNLERRHEMKNSTTSFYCYAKNGGSKIDLSQSLQSSKALAMSLATKPPSSACQCYLSDSIQPTLKCSPP